LKTRAKQHNKRIAAGKVGMIPSPILMWKYTAPIIKRAIPAAAGFIYFGNLTPPTNSNIARIIFEIPTPIIMESSNPYVANSSDMLEAVPPLKTEGRLSWKLQALNTTKETKSDKY